MRSAPATATATRHGFRENRDIANNLLATERSVRNLTEQNTCALLTRANAAVGSDSLPTSYRGIVRRKFMTLSAHQLVQSQTPAPTPLTHNPASASSKPM